LDKEHAMRNTGSVVRLCGTALLAALLVPGLVQAQEPVKKAKPKIEVVFCLDTTGSMGGMINAARAKIWSICNQIAGGEPTPDLKVGLVAFRDRGDEYVTKVYPLTDDLDAIYGHLMSFKAAGGGDFPEAVNQALNESVTKINWSNEKKTLKMIFLVGDAPPKHYPDDVPYQETCKLAVKKDIIINTIQCGDHPATKKVWLDICQLAEGKYVQISAQGGPVVVVKTPFDAELSKINTQLAKSTLIYGKAEAQKGGKDKQAAAMKLTEHEAAARAAFAGKNGISAAYDLLDCIKNGTVKLESLKSEELPKELQGLTLPQQKDYLQKVEKDRTALQQQAIELDKKRQAYIVDELKKKGNAAKDSFDTQVFHILQQQAQRINVQYQATSPKKNDGEKK
jgi:Mg-chelatase subunit ChlD